MVRTGVLPRLFQVTMTVWLALVLPSGVHAQHAQEEVVVVARAGERDAARADAIRRAAEEHLAREGARVRVLDPEPAAPDLRPALADAIDAYHDLRPAEAVSELHAILASFERRGGRGLDRNELVRALLHLALAAQATGALAEVEAAVGRALAVDPELVVDAAVYPPALARRIEAARAAIRIASVRLSIEPADALLVLDGAERAFDATQWSLPVGRHVLLVTAEGRVPESRVFDVPREGVDLAVSLAEDPVARLRDPGAPEAPTERLVASAERIGVRLFVIDIVVEGSRIVVALHEPRTSVHTRVHVERSAAPDAIVARLFGVSNGPDVLVRGTEPERPTRRRRRIAIGVATGFAGAALVATVLGATLGTRQRFTGNWMIDAR